MVSLTAKDIMTRNVITIRKGASIEEALKMMACNDISGLPVVDTENNLVGIITESDVLLKGQYIPGETFSSPSNPLFKTRTEGVNEAYRRAQASLVEDAMTRKVLIFSEDSFVVDIARAMIEHAVNRVPIVRDRKVVGIVSRKDVVKALARAANGVSNLCGSDEDADTRMGKLIEL